MDSGTVAHPCQNRLPPVMSQLTGQRLYRSDGGRQQEGRLVWHVGPTQREETRGTQGRVAQAQWCQELRQPCCGGVSQSTFNKDTRVCERYVLLILSCVSVLFPAGAHNSSAGAGGRGRPTQFFSLGKKSRRHRSLWRVTLLKCVCLSASRPPPCPTACPSRGSLHRPLPKRTRTPPRSATARRSPCSGPPASPPSSQPPPTNTQLPSVRCASLAWGQYSALAFAANVTPFRPPTRLLRHWAKTPEERTAW